MDFKDFQAVPVVEHTKFFSFSMVLMVISDERHIMPRYFSSPRRCSHPRDIPGSSEGYCEALDKQNYWRLSVRLPAGLCPQHKVKRTQAWQFINARHDRSPDVWPTSSTDCSPLNYFFRGMIEAKTRNHTHNTVDAFNTAMAEERIALDKNMVARAWNSFCSGFGVVVMASGGFIEK